MIKCSFFVEFSKNRGVGVFTNCNFRGIVGEITYPTLYSCVFSPKNSDYLVSGACCNLVNHSSAELCGWTD